ncbi:hypothetical protein CHS0354_039805 [Potamilus streckersoni]|uniref:Uncharacterized protein n=1 Tax=Potamilus streckersoni TaxID=2493646 RepID=A0AAE0W156_9BIVA|nr:hypothetical protein CHS0354_039805 [Potamilus streckersoni]
MTLPRRRPFTFLMRYTVNFVENRHGNYGIPEQDNHMAMDGNSRGFFPETMRQKWRESTLGPYIIGLVLLCYCALILCSWCDTMEATGRNIPAESQYEDLDDSDKRQWVYLDGHSPISLTTLLCGFCDLSWKYPVAVSSLRRGIFVLLSPILIFLQFLLYSTYHGDITLNLIDHGVPMGFLSMLGGMEKSKWLFVPMLGGPYCLVFMYYITGFIILLTPRNLGNVIQRGSFDSKYAGMSPLILSTKRIEEISMVSVNQYRGYKRLSMLLLPHFYLIIMPRFWIEAVLIIWRRIKCHFDLLKKYSPQPIFIILSCSVVPLHLIFGSLEMCFSLIFYAIPLIWFLLVLTIGFISSAKEYIQTQTHMKRPLSCGFVLRITMYTIIGPFLLYFVYGCFSIYLASFSIVGEIIIFLFYALVLFPSSSFGYLFFEGALLYYVWKLLKGIGDVYYELLSDLFEICTNRDYDHNLSKLHNSTLFFQAPPAPPGLGITTLQVNDRTITLTDEQTNMIHNLATTKVNTYIHYDKHIPGISRRLFMYIVRKSKPVHITVFQANFRIGLIVLLVVGTLKLAMNSQGMSSEISEVMHVLFLVVIGALPRVLEITLAQNDKAVHREIHLCMLDMLVQEFDQSKIESNDTYC